MRVLPLLVLLHASVAPASGVPGAGAPALAPVETPGRRDASQVAGVQRHAPAAPMADVRAPALDASAPESRDVLLRREVAQVALAQVRKQDAAWHPDQRDCAGLIRFAYRAAYKRVAPERLSTPLWRDGQGRPSEFADAEVLLHRSFHLLGRDDATRESLRTGDVLAFRQEQDAGPIFHLMLVVRPEDRAHAPARVVYHPGEKGAAVRTGVLRNLATEAPLEWRPVPQNASFLGFFRFKEWMS
ncbi:DUF1175 family protein [Comamonas sp. JC664]|uniref:DUF1175 family protein n=1 Tax=Comamonas sp. JC664 TaxID=2801917 RepID=UPI00191D4F65|nr:DUF1175 family protein [Comamonas sp. JC664]MBL0695284.1 DUF1175 family protein [Comamonas sp. JC664]GHG87186.1 hypothetical protein GCM10012319_44810 [Comamonas sp. KCTC 72670]